MGVQEVKEEGEVEEGGVDLRGLEEEEREEVIRRQGVRERERRVDFREGGAVKGRGGGGGGGEEGEKGGVHHNVRDGRACAVFIEELSTLYRAFSRGERSGLAELTIQYRDYAVWQREWQRGEVLEEQMRYWKKQLEGAPGVVELPTDRRRPGVQRFRSGRAEFVISGEVGRGLWKMGGSEGVTQCMTLVGAYDLLLYRYSGQGTIVVGTPVAGRTRAELEGLMGCFVNMLVMRVEVNGKESFRDLLREVREVALGAYAHQELAFEELVEEVAPERSMSHTPLMQVTFTLQNARREELELGGVRARYVEVEGGTVEFDLSLIMATKGEELYGWVMYNRELFEEGTINRLVGHLKRVLEEVVGDPEQEIGRIGLLSEVEREQVLEEWNKTEVEYPREECIHEVFEREAMEREDGVAVVKGEEAVSYGELNRRANQL